MKPAQAPRHLRLVEPRISLRVRSLEPPECRVHLAAGPMDLRDLNGTLFRVLRDQLLRLSALSGGLGGMDGPARQLVEILSWMNGFTCATCGQFHDQLPMCFGPSAPVMWFHIPEEEREARAELSSDQCVIDGRHFFILGQIVIPITDAPGPFVWLAWVSLSEQAFQRASELWNSKGREKEPPLPGRLQSALPYPERTVDLKVWLRTQQVGERPLIELEQTSHPLAVEQRSGITMRRVQEIAESVLHG